MSSRLKAKLTTLKMEEVVLEQELERIRRSIRRYKDMELESEEALDEVRVQIVNTQDSLDAD